MFGVMDSRLRYYALFCFSQACGIVSVILLATYIQDKTSMFPELQKLYFIHGFLMVLGMVYTQGTAMSAFRALNSIEKKYVAIGHVFLYLAIFVMNVIALVKIFDFNSKFGHPQLITFHGWCGLITVILFSAQMAFSLIAYFVPQISDFLGGSMTPYHRNFGLALFALSIITALIQLNQLILLGNRAETVWICILLVLFGITTFISVIHKRFKRANIYDD